MTQRATTTARGALALCASAALPKRRAGRGGAMAGKRGSRGLFAEAGQRLEAELARAAQTFAGSGGGASPAKDGSPGLRAVGRAAPAGVRGRQCVVAQGRIRRYQPWPRWPLAGHGSLW